MSKDIVFIHYVFLYGIGKIASMCATMSLKNVYNKCAPPKKYRPCIQAEQFLSLRHHNETLCIVCQEQFHRCPQKRMRLHLILFVIFPVLNPTDFDELYSTYTPSLHVSYFLWIQKSKKEKECDRQGLGMAWFFLCV